MANIILNGECFLLKSGITQQCPLSPCLFDTAVKVLASAIWQDKEIKDIWTEKEKVKLLLLAAKMIIYVENLLECTKNY